VLGWCWSHHPGVFNLGAVKDPKMFPIRKN
jgi:hypothetical protein